MDANQKVKPHYAIGYRVPSKGDMYVLVQQHPGEEYITLIIEDNTDYVGKTKSFISAIFWFWAMRPRGCIRMTEEELLRHC